MVPKVNKNNNRLFPQFIYVCIYVNITKQVCCHGPFTDICKKQQNVIIIIIKLILLIILCEYIIILLIILKKIVEKINWIIVFS